MERRLPVSKVGCERWRPSEAPFLKINFDVTFQAQITKSYSRLVIRDDRSRIICTMVILNEYVPSTFTVETLACLQALNLGVEMGLKEVVVEGDSLIVIKKAQLDFLDRSKIGAYFLDIKSENRKFREVRFTFVLRSTNESAHTLVQEG